MTGILEFSCTGCFKKHRAKIVKIAIGQIFIEHVKCECGLTTLAWSTED